MTITTHSFTSINVGSSANDGTGDELRTAFIKVNANFDYISNTGVTTGNISATAIESSSLKTTGNVIAGGSYVPPNANAGGTTGQITYDTDHVYICVATNTWKRANIATW